MNTIQITTNPGQEILERLQVYDWLIWEKEVSEFPWHYDEQETCYLLAGEVEAIPDGGEAVRIRKGDLVVFPARLACHWKILQPVKKHYQFG